MTMITVERIDSRFAGTVETIVRSKINYEGELKVGMQVHVGSNRSQYQARVLSIRKPRVQVRKVAPAANRTMLNKRLRAAIRNRRPFRIPAEALNETPLETMVDDTPTETMDDDTPTETLDDDTPTETMVDDTSTETMDDTPTDTLDDDTPTETMVDDTPTETLEDDTPTEAVDSDTTPNDFELRFSGLSDSDDDPVDQTIPALVHRPDPETCRQPPPLIEERPITQPTSLHAEIQQSALHRPNFYQRPYQAETYQPYYQPELHQPSFARQPLQPPIGLESVILQLSSQVATLTKEIQTSQEQHQAVLLEVQHLREEVRRFRDVDRKNPPVFTPVFGSDTRVFIGSRDAKVEMDKTEYLKCWDAASSAKDLVLSLLSRHFTTGELASSNFNGGDVICSGRIVSKTTLRKDNRFIAIVSQAEAQFPGGLSSGAQTKQLREAVNNKCRKLSRR